MQRAKRTLKAITKPELQGFDLTKIDLSDIDSIELDAEDHTVTVSFSVPVNQGESMADYEESFEVEQSQRLGHAAAALAKAVIEEVRDHARSMNRSEPICVTCTSKCCGRSFESVRVTQQDVERMDKAGIDVSEKTISFYSHELFSGYVGEFVLVPYDGPGAIEDETCCPHLRRTGCSIYEHRPKICREYSSYTCDIYEEDPEKTDGKVHLAVAQ